MISRKLSLVIIISVIILIVLGVLLVHDIQSTKGLNSQEKDFGSGTEQSGKINLEIINSTDDQGGDDNSA